ncbi:MAG TPA: MIP family channel protein [Candidatus Gallimonas gallistercoris]|uniref:MIP family channel protein n=1 Tax=Candidatus Gallimonas gallistercoris TaxID=2838602 RepID=A0A9D2H147_9FIRM|nr:MIP family channel protein [Candidatus Gallimonas gallistercoris]
MSLSKKCIAEFIGTMILVIFGCGVAVATGCEGNDGVVATALAFGLVIVAMAYSIGNVSGCHINPAVSLAMLLNKKMTGKEFVGYVISQVLGAIAGAAIVGLLFGSFKNLGGNAVQAAVTAQYGDVASLAIGLVAEIVLTFGFVLAILGVTSKTDNKTVTGIVIGLTLTLVHLLGIRLTGTSVNPARSLGPALLQMIGGDFTAISQIWIFIVGPLAGAALAALVYRFLDKGESGSEQSE